MLGFVFWRNFRYLRAQNHRRHQHCRRRRRCYRHRCLTWRILNYFMHCIMYKRMLNLLHCMRFCFYRLNYELYIMVLSISSVGYFLVHARTWFLNLNVKDHKSIPVFFSRSFSFPIYNKIIAFLLRGVIFLSCWTLKRECKSRFVMQQLSNNIFWMKFSWCV